MICSYWAQRRTQRLADAAISGWSYNHELTELVHLIVRIAKSQCLQIKCHIGDTSVISEMLLAIQSTYNANVWLDSQGNSEWSCKAQRWGRPIPRPRPKLKGVQNCEVSIVPHTFNVYSNKLKLR